MSLFTWPVIVGLIIYSNCCLLQRPKTRKGGYCISGSVGTVGWGPAADRGWWGWWAWGGLLMFPILSVHASVLFFSVCPSVRWFHPSEWGSALGSHLTCLMGRQELVGSMGNPPASPRWVLWALRIFLPLLHFGSFWGPSCQGQ